MNGVPMILKGCLHKLVPVKVEIVLLEGQLVCQKLYFLPLEELTLAESAT